MLFYLIGWPPRGCHLPLEPLKLNETSDLLKIKPRFFENIHLNFSVGADLNLEKYISNINQKHLKFIPDAKKIILSGRQEIWSSLTSRARNTIRKSAKYQFLYHAKS